ncbi:MAG: sigma-54 dependent transcriptional regulator [bacterium]|nr:sigma-54 dependent transcriptional regulator [bacterium]
MSDDRQGETHNWLAPIVPELVVRLAAHGVPHIGAISPAIASWTGQPAKALIGRCVADIFNAFLPGLAFVVEQVATSGTPVRDYRMAFDDVAGVPHVVRLQASLRVDHAEAAAQDVVVRMDEMPLPSSSVEPMLEEHAFHGMIGQSSALLKVFRKIEIYGPTEAPVLITGETGTGKELAARALHATSRRRHKPFIAVNGSALSIELLDSELFGHERGAFTGAVRAHKGRFERAHAGTLFLDEIGEMPMPVQVKLLRVLEEGEIERVGSERVVEVDVRLVTATNVPLEVAVQEKSFRLDLYHRLDVLRLHMPAVRERVEDIPLLTAYFLRQFDQKYHRNIQRVTPNAIRLLQAYAWPGNIRELRNVLERVYVESSTEVIGRQAFDEWVQERQRFSPGTWNLDARQTALAIRPTIVTPYPAQPAPNHALLPYYHNPPQARDVEAAPSACSIEGEWSEINQQKRPQQRGAKFLDRQRIAGAYQQADGNMTQAARLLGVHKATLYRRLQALGLTRKNLDAERLQVVDHPVVIND